MTTRVTLIRHGETAWNVNGRWQGMAPVPLNENGIAQAQAAAPALKDAGIDRIITSDLSRAYRTAEIIGEVLGLPVEADPRWREIDIGRWQGLTRPEISAWDPELWAVFNAADYVDRAFPEGESSRQHIARTEAALHDIAARFPGEHVLVATHGGCVRAAIYALTRESVGLVDNCSLTRVAHDGAAWAVSDIAQTHDVILW